MPDVICFWAEIFVDYLGLQNYSQNILLDETLSEIKITNLTDSGHGIQTLDCSHESSIQKSSKMIMETLCYFFQILEEQNECFKVYGQILTSSI